MENKQSKPLKWGYTKIGHFPTVPVAIALGFAFALGIALARVLNNPPGPHQWVSVLILAVFLTGPFSALAATLLVDRSTMTGATRNPESSIEARWSLKSAEVGFYAMIIAASLGAGFVPNTVPDQVVWAFLSIIAVGGVSFGLAYLVQRVR